MDNEIKSIDFFNRYKPTGEKRSAIFGSRKALMEEIYNLAPIYCDQTYYAIESVFYKVTKEDDHFSCERYNHFEDWRDCHYYTEYEDADGNKVWLMKGGKY